MVAPQPAHHVGQNRAAVLGAMLADAPNVIDVVVLFLERLDHAHVLKVPVALLVVLTTFTEAAIVVAAVLEEDSQRLLVGGGDALGINVAAAQIDEAADNADHF